MLAPQWRMFEHIHSQSAGIWAHMAAGACTPGLVAVSAIRAARVMAACIHVPSADAYETVKIPAQVCDLCVAEHDNSNRRPFLVDVSGLPCIPALLNPINT